MWCGHCQAEVAGQAALDNKHVMCTACGNAISVTKSMPSETEPVSKDPKELLARWASDEILDPYGPVLGKQGIAESEKSLPEIGSTTADAALHSSTPGLEGNWGMTRTLPLTTAELVATASQNQETQNHEEDEFKTPIPQEPPATSQPIEMRAEEAETADIDTPAEPETVVESLPFAHTGEHKVTSTKKRRGGALMFFGQILAYIGVASLTIGTTLVLWGYFGGKPENAPLGWLVATAGQMLLFLGGVTVISGGMEQTTSIVEEKIDALSEQIFRFEHAKSQARVGQHPLAVESQSELPELPDAAPGAAA